MSDLGNLTRKLTSVKKIGMMGAAVLISVIASAAFVDHAYIKFDAQGNMVISGPFNVIIPKPEGTRIGGPKHSTPNFLNEELKLSTAGYFADNLIVVIQIETTNARPGTLTHKNLPVYEIAGREYRARTACVGISQNELDADDDPLIEFIEDQNVQIVPGVQGPRTERRLPLRRWRPLGRRSSVTKRRPGRITS